MPAPSSLTFRVDFKVLLVVLLLTVPLLVADMFLVLDRSARTLTETIGGYTEAMAKEKAAEVARWVHWKVNNAALLATSSQIRDAVAAANRGYLGVKEETIQARFKEIDSLWESPKAGGLVARMLSSPASDVLNGFTRMDPSFRRLLVTDAYGAPVAGSRKSIDYNQSDEPWWTTTYGDGRTGRIYVEDVRFDPITRTNFFGINTPISDPQQERVIGVLRAIVDVAGMVPIISQVQVGQTGMAMLVRPDGTIICSRDVGPEAGLKAEEISVLEGMTGRPSGYAPLTFRGGRRRFVAFADTGLAPPFPELNWTVLVSQDLEEATAPVSAINRRALTSAFLGIGLIAIVAVYFTIHRPRELTDLEAIKGV